MPSPAVRAYMSRIAAFRRASKVKKHGVGVEKSNIIVSQKSVEEGMVEAPNIHTCLTSRICEHPDAGATRYFVVISKYL
jgi:hypothetical protein